MGTTDSQLALSMHVYLKNHDLQAGVMELANNMLTLADEHGTTLFRCNVDNLTRITTNATTYLTIYTTSQKPEMVVFDSFATLMTRSRSLGGVLTEMGQEKQTRIALQPWLDYFDKRGVLKRTMSTSKIRLIGLVLGVCIIAAVFLVGLQLHRIQ